MSRSGYSDDDSDGRLALWRGAVASSIRGKRGQRLLRELAEALDAMPVKELVSGELEDADGEHCALGVVGQRRGVALKTVDPDDWDAVAKMFDIASPLAREIVYMNDEVVDERDHLGRNLRPDAAVGEPTAGGQRFATGVGGERAALARRAVVGRREPAMSDAAAYLWIIGALVFAYLMSDTGPRRGGSRENPPAPPGPPPAPPPPPPPAPGR
jgi:hypothetical protein